MIINTQFIDTIIPISDLDINKYTIVSRNNVKITKGIKAKDLYCPNTNLDEHPISITTAKAVQFVADYFQIPTKIEDISEPWGPTYQNNESPMPNAHHLGQAIKFYFRVDEAINEQLILLIREDWERKGELFEKLWQLGCRGFGVTDTFLHLDTLDATLYPQFIESRIHKYKGKNYIFWDETKALKFISPSHYDMLPKFRLANNADLNLAFLPRATDIPPLDIVENVQIFFIKMTGSLFGFLTHIILPKKEITADWKDINEVNTGYFIFTIFLILLFHLGLFLIFFS